ncbi:MAG: nicotinate-nucleotide--dimethylbenzimidazole phosphoribosyltransferase, partial [Clostridia bacterium]|nr:nicotinate-nucleotide--dimethylbenzimidazole phosphoribosyltransferase [Clostridia bacterium]
MEQFLQEALNAIPWPDQSAMDAARARQNSLAKPPHSLGALEDISVKLAGITGQVYNDVDKRRLLVFAADNGIVDEGVSSCPRSVTLRQTINLARGLTGAAVLARHFNCELEVLDVGVDADFAEPGVLDFKIAHGTKNFAKEPAMTREQALISIKTGFEAARRAKDAGVDIIGVGEMGIGNTTTSSAVLSALLRLPAEQTVSRGAGLTDAALARKIALIDEAVARWRPDPRDP